MSIFLDFGDDFIYRNNLGYDLWFYVMVSFDLLDIFLENDVVLVEGKLYFFIVVCYGYIEMINYLFEVG